MTKLEFDSPNKARKKKYTWRNREYWQGLDWKSIGLKHGLPIGITLIIGLTWGYKMGNLTKALTTKSGNVSIVNTVDLPEQVSELQNTQLEVFKNTLGQLGTDDSTSSSSTSSTSTPSSSAATSDEEAENNLGNTIASVNYQTELDAFFKTYLGLDYTTNAESRYLLLKDYLADDVKADNSSKKATKLTDNMMEFLESNSWAKSSKSQTALAGSVIPSIMAGSNDKNIIYNVIVPATNEKREFANLSFIVKVDRNKKITAITYQGKISDNGNIKLWYDNLNSILTGLPVNDTSTDNFAPNSPKEKKETTDGDKAENKENSDTQKESSKEK